MRLTRGLIPFVVTKENNTDALQPKTNRAMGRTLSELVEERTNDFAVLILLHALHRKFRRFPFRILALSSDDERESTTICRPGWAGRLYVR